MRPDAALRTDLVSAGVPTFVVALLPLLGLALWVGAHRIGSRVVKPDAPKPAGTAAFALRVAVGTFALWMIWQALARFVVLETSWSLWLSAFIGALAFEIVTALFQWERRIVEPAVGRLLLGLRLGAVALVLLILVQPVLAWTQQRKIERRVVVLVDDSESMQLVDQQATATEMVETAVFRGDPAVAGRPPITALAAAARAFQSDLARELDGWPATAPADAEAERAMVERRSESLARVAESAGQLSSQSAAAVEKARPLASRMDEAGRRTIDDVAGWLVDQLPSLLNEARTRSADGRATPVRERLDRAADILRQAVESLPGLAAQTDEAFVTSLDARSRDALKAAALVPRAQLAREVLTAKLLPDGTSLLEQLEATYDVTVLRFGREAVEWPSLAEPAGAGDEGFRARTDLAGALAQTLDRVPAESLAGVLVLSEGRHNGDVPVDDAARSLGLVGAPMHAVAIGSTQGPKDAAFLKVEVPESIYLGDRLKIRADVKADGMRGQQLQVVLRHGDKEIERQTIAVPEDSHRATVRLNHTPPDKGIFAYTVQLEPVEGELFTDNNTWPFETAVTDDRTNVLLIDSVPRWEFRYLRNLFYGRDKSVHLQYVLLDPDTIDGQVALPTVFASASRKFGEAEATRLPEKFEEWMKFDVIILGDVSPSALPAQTWETIEKAVAERGALLVVVAGPRAMPHAFQSDVVRRLLPLDFAPTSDALFASPEESFAVRLTAEGRNSPILALGASQVETAQIWAEAPPFMWRHPVRGAKPGSEVLAYAEPAGQRPPTAAATAEERLAAFARQRQFEAERALLTTSRYGLGRVALFTTDQTWRLRYGVGDTYHHRLWGNLLRWGTAENLRAGTDTVRLGTDALTYETGQRVRLLARLTAEGYKPETNAEVTALVFAPDGTQVASRRLAYRDGSSGIYEAELEPLAANGRYRVELVGEDVTRMLRSGTTQGSGSDTVETHFTQLATLNPVELGDLSLNLDLLRRATTLAGGRVVSPSEVSSLTQAFGTGTKILEERRETTLWDNWPLLTLLIAALTAEWLLRRRAGLA
ncbi:MAG: hypothetical protein ACKV19_22080 [Verrucomicrobiales bacterium]